MSKAAYTLVDLSDLDPKVRDQLIVDANAGGGTYGLRVVEEVVNGGVRAPIYGYYKDGPDADLWSQAKKDLGLSADDVDDGAVVPAQPDISNDPRREAALREAAAASAGALADRIRSGDDAAVEAITGGGALAPSDTGVSNVHSTNIVDTSLASDATNRVEDAEQQTAEQAPARGKSTNKAPK